MYAATANLILNLDLDAHRGIVKQSNDYGIGLIVRIMHDLALSLEVLLVQE